MNCCDEAYSVRCSTKCSIRLLFTEKIFPNIRQMFDYDGDNTDKKSNRI